MLGDPVSSSSSSQLCCSFSAFCSLCSRWNEWFEMDVWAQTPALRAWGSFGFFSLDLWSGVKQEEVGKQNCSSQPCSSLRPVLIKDCSDSCLRQRLLLTPQFPLHTSRILGSVFLVSFALCLRLQVGKSSQKSIGKFPGCLRLLCEIQHCVYFQECCFGFFFIFPFILFYFFGDT